MAVSVVCSSTRRMNDATLEPLAFALSCVVGGVAFSHESCGRGEPLYNFYGVLGLEAWNFLGDLELVRLNVRSSDSDTR